MIYCAIKDGRVIPHANKDAAINENGSEIIEVTEEEFYAGNGMCRIIKGSLFIGETEQEKKLKENHERIFKIDREIAKIDEKSIRSSRAIKVAEFEKIDPDPFDFNKLKELEEQAAALRTERAQLETEITTLHKEIVDTLGISGASRQKADVSDSTVTGADGVVDESGAEGVSNE